MNNINRFEVFRQFPYRIHFSTKFNIILQNTEAKFAKNENQFQNVCVIFIVWKSISKVLTHKCTHCRLKSCLDRKTHIKYKVYYDRISKQWEAKVRKVISKLFLEECKDSILKTIEIRAFQLLAHKINFIFEKICRACMFCRKVV